MLILTRQNIRFNAVCVRAMIPMYPDPEYMAQVSEEFPDKMIANTEEARCLIDQGYKMLDVRSDLEIDNIGKWKGAITVPFVFAKFRYDAEQKKKVADKTPNDNFVAMVEKKIPNKETPLLVCCADGTQYSLDALEALDEAGYSCIVGMKGGYYAWFRIFDNNLRRRLSGEYSEQYTHDGDSCGIHSSGAGFARVDAIEQWVPPKF